MTKKEVDKLLKQLLQNAAYADIVNKQLNEQIVEAICEIARTFDAIRK
jgi:hypothetical protein